MNGKGIKKDEFEAVKWFKKAAEKNCPEGPLKWIPIDVDFTNRTLLIISETPFEMPYNDEYTPVTWESCSLRKWLNGEFLDCFSKEEKAKIVDTVVRTPGISDFGKDGGNVTTDKVFILSYIEQDGCYSSGTWLRTSGTDLFAECVGFNNDGAAVNSFQIAQPAMIIKF